jgi:CRP-like cAMP-binding protein
MMICSASGMCVCYRYRAITKMGSRATSLLLGAFNPGLSACKTKRDRGAIFVRRSHKPWRVVGITKPGADDWERRALPPARAEAHMMIESNRAALDVLVRRLECIGHLSDEERHAIEKLPVRIQAFASRQDIVRDGEKPKHCCLLVEGWAFRYKLVNGGKRQILSFHVPGDVPDLHSLHIEAMDHSLATLTKATIAFIPHESLLDVTARFPGLAAILWRETLIDAAIFRQWIAGMGQRDALSRMAHLLCELYCKLEAMGLAVDHSCKVPITQEELGDALGLSSVHTNRVLMDLRKQELITFRSKALSITAWDRLVQAAEFDPSYLQLRK